MDCDKRPDYQNINAGEFSKICLQHQVVLAPGNSFSQSKQARHFLRFNVAQCNDKRVYDVLEIAIQQMLARSEAQSVGLT